ncbi:MAG: cardiolipin synthase [Bacteroidales bacterium]
MNINDTLHLAFQSLYLITSLTLVLVLIYENRNPVKSMAWITVLIFVPFVGIIIYLFFGQDYTRMRMLNKRRLKYITDKLHNHNSKEILKELPSQYQTLAKLLNYNNQSPLYANNNIRIFTSGKDKIDALFEALNKAQNYIHLQYYIIESDELGLSLQDILIKKSKEGVEVKILYDDVGCWKVPNEYFNKLKEAGVEVLSFLPVKFHLFTSKVNYRNHRKMVIIDGEMAFMGGMNIADRYIKGTEHGAWRDTHIEIRGSAINALQAQFLIDKQFTDKQTTNIHKYKLNSETEGSSTLQIVQSGPFGIFRTILQGYIKAILSAKKSIYLQSPYFLPTESLLVALQTAALSGVDVRLMLPRRSDVYLAHHASRSFIQQMLEAGVKVYLYEAGFLHSKTVIIDDYLSIVGSVNLDFRSFEHNFELNSFIYDSEVASKMKHIFSEDQRHSTRLTLTEWKARPLKSRMLASLWRLLSPLL